MAAAPPVTGRDPNRGRWRRKPGSNTHSTTVHQPSPRLERVIGGEVRARLRVRAGDDQDAPVHVQDVNVVPVQPAEHPGLDDLVGRAAGGAAAQAR